MRSEREVVSHRKWGGEWRKSRFQVKTNLCQALEMGENVCLQKQKQAQSELKSMTEGERRSQNIQVSC